MAKRIRVGIWVRVSSPQQAKTDSPKHHLLRARAYAEARGWEVVEVYNLEGVKGDEVDGHPETERMLRDIRSGHINVLIFSRLARLGRSLKTLIELAEEFKKYDAQLVSLGENLDTSSSIGRAFFFLAALFAEMEKERIAERIQDSVEIRGQLGKRLGPPVYGYQWNAARQLEIVEEEAHIRKLIYAWFIKYQKLHLVAEELNACGYRKRPKKQGQEGEPWAGEDIKRLIQDTTAKGTRRALYSKNGKGRMLILPESEWKWLPAPAIVDEEIWNQANEILAGLSKQVIKAQQHLFAGILFCGCGGKLYRNRPDTGSYYRCNQRGCKNAIRLEELEQIFLDEIESFYCLDDSSRSEQIEDAIGLKKKRLQGLQRDLTKLEKEQKKLEAEFLELPAAFFSRKLSELESRREQLQTELPRVQGELDNLQLQAAEQAAAAAEAQEIRMSWSSLPEKEKRDLAAQLIERIEVTAEQVEVKLNALPDLFDKRRQGA